MHGMKCHDHHALLQDILPIAIGGFLTKEVTEPIIELEKFFKNLCSKCLTIEDLDILEAEIITTLYELEIIFPPAFFDAMIHLPIHLAREAKLGRPVQYQWMYPIERQTNCTSEGIVLPHDEFKKACLHVLQNCEEVSPFMEEYTREIERKVLVGDEMLNNDFLDWFRARIFVLSAQGHANDELKSLAVGPYPLVHRYSTYMVNGFRFHRKELELRRKTQNSGVLVRGDNSDSNKEYYGILEDIYEFSHVGNRKFYLFKCHWWDVARLGRGYKIDKHGFTSTNTHSTLNTNEPFVLASQSEQVFYLNDMVNKDWLIVVKKNPRDLLNMPEHDNDSPEVEDEAELSEEAYQQEEVEFLFLRSNDQENVTEVSLQSDDVEPQRFNFDHASKQTQISVYTGEDDFIYDKHINESDGEESEEGLLDVTDREDTDTFS